VKLCDGPSVLTVADENTVLTPYGAHGSGEGRPHGIWIERGNAKIELNDRSNDMPILSGDLIVHHAAGGGCGDPRERSGALVKRDLAFGYITRETAHRAYGYEE
jgi:N-methylhydantoinase B